MTRQLKFRSDSVRVIESPLHPAAPEKSYLAPSIELVGFEGRPKDELPVCWMIFHTEGRPLTFKLLIARETDRDAGWLKRSHFFDESVNGRTIAAWRPD